MALNILRNNLNFSSLFSVESESVNQKFKKALETFGLHKLIHFESVKFNCDHLIHTELDFEPGPEGSRILDVPGNGDCSINALLAPLLGFVIDWKVNISN